MLGRALVRSCWAALLLVAACGTPPVAESTTVGVEADLPDAGLTFATTFGDADGNKYVAGVGAIEPTSFEDVDLGFAPQWMVGISDGDRIVLAATSADGQVSGLAIDDSGVSDVPLNLTALPAGTPPALVAGSGVLLISPPGSTASSLTNAVALDTGGLAFILNDGAVVIADGIGNRRLEVDALLDGRLTVSSDGLMAVLVDPTDRYPHAIAGDALEAGAVAFVSLETQQEVARTSFGDVDVFEGLYGMFADLTGNGTDELVVTLSNRELGAWLAVIDEDGEIVAESSPIGRSNRWRHQLAVGPFGPDGEIELVDVRTPHIGGIVEFFRLDGGVLDLAATAQEYSTHAIGSRNLDMAAAFDVDGDGRAEVIVPTVQRDELHVLGRVVDSVETVMVLPLEARLSSNLVAVPTSDGGIVLVAGLADGRIRIWR